MEQKDKYNNSPEEVKTEEEPSVNEFHSNEEEFENTDSVNDEIPALKKELDEQKDKYVRLFAEFDNFKRRNAKERIELIQTAGKDVIISMLDVLDDCDRAEKQMNADNPDQTFEGIQLVFNKLRTSLLSQGLKAMESINTDFDVHKHEAIAELPVDDDDKKGKVIDEIVKGYYLNDKLIRFAKVIVGK